MIVNCNSQRKIFKKNFEHFDVEISCKNYSTEIVLVLVKVRVFPWIGIPPKKHSIICSQVMGCRVKKREHLPISNTNKKIVALDVPRTNDNLGSEPQIVSIMDTVRIDAIDVCQNVKTERFIYRHGLERLITCNFQDLLKQLLQI